MNQGEINIRSFFMNFPTSLSSFTYSLPFKKGNSPSPHGNGISRPNARLKVEQGPERSGIQPAAPNSTPHPNEFIFFRRNVVTPRQEASPQKDRETQPTSTPSLMQNPEKWWKGFFRTQVLKYATAPLVALKDIDPTIGTATWAISRGSGILSSTFQAGQGKAQINTKKCQEGKTTVARAGLQLTSDVLGFSIGFVSHLILGGVACGFGILASAASIYKYTQDLKKNGSEIQEINARLKTTLSSDTKNKLLIKLNALKWDSFAQKIAMVSRLATGASNVTMAVGLGLGLSLGLAALTTNPVGWTILGLLSLAALTMIISTCIRLQIRDDYRSQVPYNNTAQSI